MNRLRLISPKNISKTNSRTQQRGTAAANNVVEFDQIDGIVLFGQSLTLSMLQEKPDFAQRLKFILIRHLLPERELFDLGHLSENFHRSQVDLKALASTFECLCKGDDMYTNILQKVNIFKMFLNIIINLTYDQSKFIHLYIYFFFLAFGQYFSTKLENTGGSE